METVELERLKLCIIQRLDEKLLDQFAAPRKVAIETMGNFLADEIAIQVVQAVYGHDLEVIECRYPADWWQAFKERWFPAWAKERWSVLYRHYRLTAKELYPKVSAPRQEYHILLEKRMWWEG